METDTAVPVPKLFMPHPNLSDEVNRNIVQSEIEGGVYLDNLSDGEVLEVETKNRWYIIVVGSRGKDLIWGHPKYCPEPVAVRIEGSTWGGSMLKVRFVRRGMMSHHSCSHHIRINVNGVKSREDSNPGYGQLFPADRLAA